MELRFDPQDLEQVEETLRLLKARHPIMWARVADCPMEGLSVRTRAKLQEHCLCSKEQLQRKTREEAVRLLGHVAVSELEDVGLNEWAE